MVGHHISGAMLEIAPRLRVYFISFLPRIFAAPSGTRVYPLTGNDMDFEVLQKCVYTVNVKRSTTRMV